MKFQGNYGTTVGFIQHEPEIGCLHTEYVDSDDTAFLLGIDVYEYQGERTLKYYHRDSGDPFYIFRWKRIATFREESEYLRFINNRKQ